MEDESIRASWRAAIVPGNGGRVIYGRSNRVGKSNVVVGVDQNLKPGFRCNLALMLPKSRPDMAEQIIQGRGEVVMSVLSSMQFQVTVKWLDLDGNSEGLLDDLIQRTVKK